MSDAFVVDSAVLLQEVRLAREFIGARVPKPALQCIKLSASAGEAEITATDLDVSLTRRFEVGTTLQQRAFTALIPADHLASIAKECPGMLQIESGTLKDEPCVVIRHSPKTTAGEPAATLPSEFRLYIQPLDVFPPTACVELEFSVVKVSIGELAEALRWSLPALDKYSRFGLVLRHDEGGIMVAATNGQVMSTFGGVKAEGVCSARKVLVLNRKIVDRLLTVLEREIKANPAADTVELRFDEEKAIFCVLGNKWQMAACCAKADFPEQAWKITRREDTTYAAVSAEKFRKAFKEVVTAVKNGGEDLITIAFTDKGLSLSAVATCGTVERPVGGACRGIRTDVQIPPRCLKDWLKLLPKDDKLGIAAIDRYEPVIFMPQSHNTTWVVAGQRRPVEKKETQSAVAAASEAA